jgi:predicted Rossmann fold nucleotide-binding protein DprA/Smf involved in DNA uptake
MILNTVWEQVRKMTNDCVIFLGNTEILKNPKTAFLCSNKYSSKSVLLSYDWAKEQRESGICVVSGFHSIIEKDVFNILSKGIQPIILVLARGMYKIIPDNVKPLIDAGRMLIIAPFDDTVTRITRETAEKRNKYILEISNHIVIAHLTLGGQLESLIAKAEGKTIEILDRS